MTQIKLIVGLGNPGGQYALNRHNIGFMVVDSIAKSYDMPDFKAKNKYLFTSGDIEGHKVILCKPQTYMNLSGQAVVDIANFYKIKPEEVLVVHDDLELDPGKIRIKLGGGHGGHNGLRDIDAKFSKNYYRLRIGIGRPPLKSMVHSHVLGNFSQKELDDFVVPLLQNIVEYIPLLLDKKPDLFQTRVIEGLRQ